MPSISIEELKEKFPIGSFVKYINESSYAIVTGHDQIEDVLFLEVKWIEPFTVKPLANGGYYWQDFELVDFPKINYNTCPRCSNEMTKKLTQEYGLIDKCPNCGYC